MFPDVPDTGLPLSGLRVLDVTIWQQGPYSTAMLADFGADVIKIEGPDSPDPGRGLTAGGLPGKLNGYFETNNRNKRGIVIDLKHPEGREVLLKLAETADVIVSNMRLGVLDRLGLSYEDVKARNPKIIYAVGSGYGPKGPHAQWPAMDTLGQARSGMMMMVGAPDQPPTFSTVNTADQVGGMMLSYGILLALWHRARTGEGQRVDGSLLGGQIVLQAHHIATSLINETVPERRFRSDAAPLWNSYKCRDGRYLTLSMAQFGRWWPNFAAAMGLERLAEDERFCTVQAMLTNRVELVAILDEVFATRDQWDWVNDLCEKGLAVAPVQDYGQLEDDPQVVANRYIQTVPHPSGQTLKLVAPAIELETTPGTFRRVAPEFGEHTEEILIEAGYDWDQIGHLREVGAVGAK
jgi:crotonobetainyl-CoA:carnitine CoA-transferase CaiB-like acyl-CoA transferase